MPTLNFWMARAGDNYWRWQGGDNAHAYCFNGPDRLPRQVALLIRRQAVLEQELVDWLDSFATSASVNRAFGSVAGMTELHNSKLFIRALSDQLQDAEFPDQLRTALARLVALFTELV